MPEVATSSTSKTNSALTWERGVKVVMSPSPAHRAFGGDMMAWGNKTLVFLPHPRAAIRNITWARGSRCLTSLCSMPWPAAQRTLPQQQSAASWAAWLQGTTTLRRMDMLTHADPNAMTLGPRKCCHDPWPACAQGLPAHIPLPFHPVLQWLEQIQIWESSAVAFSRARAGPTLAARVFPTQELIWTKFKC